MATIFWAPCKNIRVSHSGSLLYRSWIRRIPEGNFMWVFSSCDWHGASSWRVHILLHEECQASSRHCWKLFSIWFAVGLSRRRILWRLMGAVERGEMGQENICVVNTALIFLLFAHREHCLSQTLHALQIHQLAHHPMHCKYCACVGNVTQRLCGYCKQKGSLFDRGISFGLSWHFIPVVTWDVDIVYTCRWW